jgi:hypothetical protein
MSIELKIKNKHLAEEARIIRFEEKKQKKLGNFITVDRLRDHRKHNVRNENRATSLARAYIAGMPYKSVEARRNPAKEDSFRCYVIPRVFTMIKKYADRNLPIEVLTAWLDAK